MIGKGMSSWGMFLFLFTLCFIRKKFLPLQYQTNFNQTDYDKVR
jgi:hypothetical protein